MNFFHAGNSRNYILNSKAYRPVKSGGRNGRQLAVIITDREQTYHLLLALSYQ